MNNKTETARVVRGLREIAAVLKESEKNQQEARVHLEIAQFKMEHYQIALEKLLASDDSMYGDTKQETIGGAEGGRCSDEG